MLLSLRLPLTGTDQNQLVGSLVLVRLHCPLMRTCCITCSSHAHHMHITSRCITLHAHHITCTSHAHAHHMHMHITCSSHAHHITCPSHHMLITCTSHALLLTQGFAPPEMYTTSFSTRSRSLMPGDLLPFCTPGRATSA